MITKRETAGFTLIELMVVVAIIGILAVAAIPGYVGFQNRARRGTMERSAKTAEYELSGWIVAARSGISSPAVRGLLVEVDTNYDGQITAADDNNLTLHGGVSDTYAAARSGGVGLLRPAELSPFRTMNGCPVDQQLFTSLGVVLLGVIQQCTITIGDIRDLSDMIDTIEMTVADQDTNTIMRAVISAN